MTKAPDENPSALKHLFGKALLRRMSESLSRASPSFDPQKFRTLWKELQHAEMKPRVRLIREELRRQFSADYPKALRILLKSTQDGTLQGFDLWPYTDFIETYGLEHRDLSLAALQEITRRFTAEFAVRPFLRLFPDETLKFLTDCARDSDVHLRRWASEGSRPRLPWGERLHAFVRDPSPTLPILEILKFDPELYVRKSVSNHLNDISKDHPEKVVKILARWKKEAGAEDREKVDWIIRRALRSLIKAGHPGALKLIGVSRDARVRITNFRLNRKSFRVGDRIEIRFDIRSLSERSEKIVIDYVLHFLKANGKTSPKVFKLKAFALPAKGEATIEKSHSLKAITTRVFYSGKHALEVQVNGSILHRTEWMLGKASTGNSA